MLLTCMSRLRMRSGKQSRQGHAGCWSNFSCHSHQWRRLQQAKTGYQEVVALKPAMTSLSTRAEKMFWRPEPAALVTIMNPKPSSRPCDHTISIWCISQRAQSHGCCSLHSLPASLHAGGIGVCCWWKGQRGQELWRRDFPAAERSALQHRRQRSAAGNHHAVLWPEESPGRPGEPLPAGFS